jgi:hypothetical protein
LLVYARNLAWDFSAETLSILFIEVRRRVGIGPRPACWW